MMKYMLSFALSIGMISPALAQYTRPAPRNRGYGQAERREHKPKREEYAIGPDGSNGEYCIVARVNDLGMPGNSVNCHYFDSNGERMHTRTVEGVLTGARKGRKVFEIVRSSRPLRADKSTTYLPPTDPVAGELAEKHREAEARIVRPEYLRSWY